MDLETARAEHSFTTRKLSPTFGLEIAELDLSKPLAPRVVDRLAALSAEHKLLVFKHQHISPDQLIVFAEQFGDTNQAPADALRYNWQNKVSRIGGPETPDGKPAPLTGYDAVSRFWHTDSSWRPMPTWLTFLTAVQLPDAGGETAFADMQAAYDALPEGRKALLEGKSMIHNWIALRRCEPTVPPMGEDVPPPVTHPIVRTVAGRRGLYLNSQVCYYVGNMPLDQGERLFDELLAHATSPPFVYQHAWSPGDLVMWDNRATMHRVMPYDTTQRRILYRAEVIGTEIPA